MLAKWFPTSERSTAAGVIYSGQMIGTMLTMPLAALICDWGNDSNDSDGWPSMFYMFGMAGVLWSILWAWLIYETPAQHPTISQTELRLILSTYQNKENKSQQLKKKVKF